MPDLLNIGRPCIHDNLFEIEPHWSSVVDNASVRNQLDEIEHLIHIDSYSFGEKRFQSFYLYLNSKDGIEVVLQISVKEMSVSIDLHTCRSDRSTHYHACIADNVEFIEK